MNSRLISYAGRAEQGYRLPMGTIYYGGSATPIHIEDRPLAHLKVVIATKLRRGESFTLSWQHPDDQPRGRSTIWLNPSVPLRFVFDDPEAPELNRNWIEQLANSRELVGRHHARRRALRHRAGRGVRQRSAGGRSPAGESVGKRRGLTAPPPRRRLPGSSVGGEDSKEAVHAARGLHERFDPHTVQSRTRGCRRSGTAEATDGFVQKLR